VVDAGLGLFDVLADHLTGYIVGAVGDLGGEDAGRVGGENVAGEGVGGIGDGAGHVVADGFELLEEGEVTAEFLGLCDGNVSDTSLAL
jgi:hypothetical protein